MIAVMRRCRCRTAQRVEAGTALILCPKCGGVRPLSKHYKREKIPTVGIVSAPFASKETVIEMGTSELTGQFKKQRRPRK
jgi:hypothetical protein